ncbi:alpha/beta fold hydrolase [Roseovarius pacificus]|uniref:alpha/beta fold hydrolase n=1 Tax=Roseovarius pacificus TaxID=337701 RepID=UPI00403A0D00
MKTLRPTSAGPLEVIRRGPEQGETVIFLHHGFGTAASMQAVMDVFAVRWPDLRLIAYSRPGCGLSPKRAAAKSVDYLHIEATEGCCQTNSNQSQIGQVSCPLCHAKTTPLGESGGAVQLEI